MAIATEAGTQGLRRGFLIAMPSGTTDILERAELELPDGMRVALDNPTQRVLIPVMEAPTVLRFHYQSRLEVTTRVLPEESQLHLPRLSRTTLLLHDQNRAAVGGATVMAEGGQGRFTWHARLESATDGTVQLTYPQHLTAPVEIEIDAPGYAHTRRHLELGSANTHEVTLSAGARIIGAFSDVATAEPLAVSLRLSRVSAESFELIRTTTARRDVVLDGLRPGDYQLDIAVPKRGFQRLRLKLSPGQDAYIGTVDISAPSRFAGEVRSTQGRPLPGVRVRLVVDGMGPRDPPEAVTNADGRFEFAGVMAGDYGVELFRDDLGWQSTSLEPISLAHDSRIQRVFVFEGSGCSLRLAFDDAHLGVSATYTVALPVSDRTTNIQVTKPDVRVLKSVPCEGHVAIWRTGQQGVRQSLLLSPGESAIEVPYISRGTTVVRVIAGGDPLVGWHVWAVRRGSSETVAKGGFDSVTDDSGRATVALSSSEGITLYLQRESTTAVIPDASLRKLLGELEIDLPNRHLRGVASDEQGKPAGGVNVAGMTDARSNEGAVRSGVTQFKARTRADGTFDVPGVAPGDWTIHFATAPAAEGSPTVTIRRLEVDTAAEGVVTVEQVLKGRPQ